jgi:two-component system, NtrC family, sensor kinase
MVGESQYLNINELITAHKSNKMKDQSYTTLFFFKPVVIAIFLFICPLPDFFGVSFFNSIKAQDTLVYTADQTLKDVGEYVHFYKDETNTLNFEQIKNLPDSAFQKSTASPLRFGTTTASIWLKVAVKNQTESPLFLAFQLNALQLLDAYIYDEAGKLTIKEALIEEEFQHSNPVINIGQSPKVLYIKIQSIYNLQFPLVLSRLEPLNYHYHKRDVINGLGMGILIAMALYNLFIFFLVKDRLYLYYCLYVLTSIWTIAHLNGLGLLIWKGNYLISNLIGIPFVLLAAWLFTVRFLNLDKNMPRIYTAIKILCILIACIIPIDFLSLQVIRAPAQQLLTPISTLTMLAVGILSHFQGNKSAKYYVLSWIFFLGGATITSLCYAGRIPYNYFTLNAVILGACMETILLAFALANRINIYRAESAKAQALAFLRLEENETLIREQNKGLEEKVHQRTTELETSLETLKATQNQLIQSEKLASLGELTAGIAHEIQNPLNFVNNFSELSVDLVKDLKDEMEKSPLTPEGEIIISPKNKRYIDELFGDLTSNQEKINHHGKRASGIVKGMLEHSRASTGLRELTDINKLVDEYLRISYRGFRAKDKDFEGNFTTDFERNLPKIEVIPQDMGRVLLNLINNAFYAVNQRKQALRPPEGETYVPTVIVSTHYEAPSTGVGVAQIIIRVKDNGIGMPENIRAKVFQPFFTTKPTGQATGLGLSLAYDIVTMGHGGTLEVESTDLSSGTHEGVGTVFSITLPFTTNGL